MKPTYYYLTFAILHVIKAVTVAIAAQSLPGITWICIVLSYCPFTWQVSNENRALAMIYQWSQLDFLYSSDLDRQHAIESREFIPAHTVPMDIDVFYLAQNKTKVFVTIPRMRDGVPATLGTISDKLPKNLEIPIIEPYPNWTWHQQPKLCLPVRMVSVFRVKLDKCGRLWVLDNGRYLNKQTCLPQILAFNADTNELIHRYEIPESQIESTSLLVTITVDVRDRECSDTVVYIADSKNFALIVYDAKSMKSWKIIDKTMYPYPNFGTFHIAGQSFDQVAGILGMDLSPYKSGQDRILFFHAIASGTENWVYTSYLRNQSLFFNSTSPAPQIFHTSYPNERHSQAAGMAVDKNGIAYFSQLSDNSINCWNINTPYKERNIDELARNAVTMQFISGVKVIPKKQGSQELWFLSMKYQKAITDTYNMEDLNFRVFVGKIDDLLRHSKCRNNRQKHNNS